MREKTKGFIAGVIAASAISGIVLGVAAEDIYKTVQIAYDNIKICIDGAIIEPKDANGNTVEPFTLDGTTYLPVRAVAGAFNKEVDWDDATSTVYIGKKPDSGVAAADGSRSNPYGPSAGVTIPFNEYSFEPTSQVQVKCLKVITGEAANFLVSKENSNNVVSSSNQEWLFLEMELTHVSSSEGEDSALSASDIIYYKDCFYKPDGSAIPANDNATLGDIYGGYNATSVEVYPGGTSKVAVGILTEKNAGDILLKVPYDGGEKNHWIKCNDSTNVISTVAELEDYLGLIDEENNENSPVKITLRTSLPTTISSYNYSDKIESSAVISDFTCSVNNSTVDISFTGEKTYDIEGAGQSRSIKVGWKLYDAEGYVVESGTASSTSIKMGEKFKNCEDRIYSLDPGEYELEIMNVN